MATDPTLKALLTTWREEDEALKPQMQDAAAMHSTSLWTRLSAEYKTRDLLISQLEATLPALGERQETAEPPQESLVETLKHARSLMAETSRDIGAWVGPIDPPLPAEIADINSLNERLWRLRNYADRLDRCIDNYIDPSLAAHREGPATAAPSTNTIAVEYGLPPQRIRVQAWDGLGVAIGYIDFDGTWKTDADVPFKWPVTHWAPMIDFAPSAHREGRPPAAETVDKP